MLTVEDRLNIYEVMALYGHVIDFREWSRFKEVFVEDLVMDGTDLGGARMEGMANLIAQFSADEASHPLAHHTTNIVIWEDPDGTVRAQSKHFGPRPSGEFSKAVTYKDVLRRTPDGWRIAERVALLMRPRPNK
jgi:hypothetical protein